MDFFTRHEAFFEITSGYSEDGVLFYQSVLFKNKKGAAYAIYEKIDDEDGFYRRINAEGAHSLKWFPSFDECIKHHGADII
ncbi:hypothetical protein [Robiginitalea sp. SC105]|uniref:hypothetical protein n=1 Tax=Robiginitalea sp. SC105 TaxID=2762332 RepID=UPI00163A0392|nr:hypothetical protein [Robiginitalea sp. SC105]MBC2838878.1 hypothetical protein [Robiginitalea sp. SC105]